MTESELEKLAIDRLTAAGIVSVLDRHHSQFLWVGEEFFAEVVLTDASKQADADRLMKEIAEEMHRTGTRLEVVVRSIWQVGEIRYLGPARTPEGGLMTALDFRAHLRSGGKEIDVRVDVTIAALTVLRQRLGIEKFIMHIGWSPQKGDVSEEHIGAAVKVYLETQLEQGGTSYWDPLLQSHLTLNEAAMSYVLGHSTAFQELHTAVTDAFSPSVRKSFLQSLAMSKINIGDFVRVLPELSNMLGGAYKRGQQFSVSASELFNNLKQGERELLKAYFLARAQKLSSEEPELIKHYQTVFSPSKAVRR